MTNNNKIDTYATMFATRNATDIDTYIATSNVTDIVTYNATSVATDIATLNAINEELEDVK